MFWGFIGFWSRFILISNTEYEIYDVHIHKYYSPRKESHSVSSNLDLFIAYETRRWQEKVSETYEKETVINRGN